MKQDDGIFSFKHIRTAQLRTVLPFSLQSLFLAPVLSCHTILLLAQGKINGHILLLSGQGRKVQVFKAKTHFKGKEIEAPKIDVFPKSKLVKKPGIESRFLKSEMGYPRPCHVNVVAWFPVAPGCGLLSLSLSLKTTKQKKASKILNLHDGGSS